MVCDAHNFLETAMEANVEAQLEPCKTYVIKIFLPK